MEEIGEEEKMNQGNKEKMQMNSDDEPVVEDPKLPAMENQSSSEDVMGGIEETTGANLMSEPAPKIEEDKPSEEYKDMEPKESDSESAVDATSFAAGEHGEGYLRLVISVDEDKNKMEVIDASVIDGPLVEEDLTGQMLYQALIGKRRVSAGGLPDLSDQHGFAPPDDENKGHSTTKITNYQFVARIPRAEITLDELPGLEIDLVRPNSTTDLSIDAPAARAMAFTDLAAEAGVEPPQVVAHLKGVNLDELPENAVESLKKGLR